MQAVAICADAFGLLMRKRPPFKRKLRGPLMEIRGEGSAARAIIPKIGHATGYNPAARLGIGHGFRDARILEIFAHFVNVALHSRILVISCNAKVGLYMLQHIECLAHALTSLKGSGAAVKPPRAH